MTDRKDKTWFRAGMLSKRRQGWSMPADCSIPALQPQQEIRGCRELSDELTAPACSVGLRHITQKQKWFEIGGVFATTCCITSTFGMSYMSIFTPTCHIMAYKTRRGTMACVDGRHDADKIDGLCYFTVL